MNQRDRSVLGAKKTTKTKKNVPQKGFSKSGAAPSKGPTSKELLTRSERNFEEIELAYAHDLEAGRQAASDSDDDEEEIDTNLRLKYFIVAVRLKGDEARAAATGVERSLVDWVPCVQLAILDKKEVVFDNKFLSIAAATFAREVHCAITTQIPSTSKIAAPLLEYAVEPLDSFEKFVYPMFDPSFKDEKGDRMGKQEALTVLFPEPPATAPDAAAIKKAYRKLSMKYHPDASIGASESELEAITEANAKGFSRVQAAYTILGAQTHSSGLSWYEALGGTDRTDFSRKLDLSAYGQKIGVAHDGAVRGHGDKERGSWSQAVQSVDADIANFFATRNALSAANDDNGE